MTRGLNLFERICGCAEYGAGQIVRRKIWSKYEEPSFWKVTRIVLKDDMKHGKAFGVFTFRGRFIQIE